MEKEPEYLNKLNSRQREAATLMDGKNLIYAGAGTGKTTVLVSRVAYLLDNNVDPGQILLLTFTNKAAKEMQMRIISLIGEDGADITACTFHSFCANFLRKYAHFVGYKNSFNILDETDSKEAMSLAKEEFLASKKEAGVDYGDLKEFPKADAIHEIFQWSINSEQSLGECINRFNEKEYECEIEEIISLFISYKKKRNLMDYDDLLFFTKCILERNEDIRAGLDRKYRYISCDEYQDTNRIQDDILSLMSRDYPNLTVVGDSNQSIYSFRCADVRNILGFEKRNPGCHTVVLNKNYRSTQEILNLSNAMMLHSDEAVKYDLKGLTHGPKPMLCITNNNTEECQYIIDNIMQMHAKGTPYNKMAVIIRSARQSFELELYLHKEKIPFEKFGGMKFFEKGIIKDILAFLRVCVNKEDEISLYRLLKLYPGIGGGSAKKITTEVMNNGFDVIDTMFVKAKFHPYIEEVKDVINKLSEMSLKDQIDTLLKYYQTVCEMAIDSRNINDSKKAEAKVDFEKKMKEAEALADLIGGYDSTKKFLEDSVLESATGKRDPNALNITTIHSAKGLEYDVVFIMDVADKITPQCKEGSSEDAEELRCMYVAVTRAKKMLHLVIPEIHYKWNGGLTCVLSHLINRDDIIETMDTTADQYTLERIRYEQINDF